MDPRQQFRASFIMEALRREPREMGAILEEAKKAEEFVFGSPLATRPPVQYRVLTGDIPWSD